MENDTNKPSFLEELAGNVHAGDEIRRLQEEVNAYINSKIDEMVKAEISRWKTQLITKVQQGEFTVNDDKKKVEGSSNIYQYLGRTIDIDKYSYIGEKLHKVNVGELNICYDGKILNNYGSCVIEFAKEKWEIVSDVKRRVFRNWHFFHVYDIEVSGSFSEFLKEFCSRLSLYAQRERINLKNWRVKYETRVSWSDAKEEITHIGNFDCNINVQREVIPRENDVDRPFHGAHFRIEEVVVDYSAEF